MNAVLPKPVSDLPRRKVQTAVVALIVFLSSLTATLALTLLVETDAPFDRAFNQVQGAHLFVTFDAQTVSAAQLRPTGSLPGISAAGGPWQLSPASIIMAGGRPPPMPVAGLDPVGGSGDRLPPGAGRFCRRLAPGGLSR